MIAAALAALTVGGLPAADFRYRRTLPEQVRSGAVAFEPAGPLLAHTAGDLADLRIADGSGGTVPWRPVPDDRISIGREARVLNAGTQAGEAVALLDTGAPRRVYERVALRIDRRDFVGRITASGADRREGPFTRLSTTTVYDVSGATSARSTTIVLPPSDVRYLLLRGQGVGRITGATVLGGEDRPRLVHRQATARRPARTAGRQTILTLDLGGPGTPVTRAELGAAAPARYDRPVTIEASDDGRSYTVAGTGTMRRAGSTVTPVIALDSRARFLRVRVDNGDDPPLQGLTVTLFGPSRAVMVEGGHPAPLTAYYGAPLGPPSYEFARLPVTRPVAILPPSALPAEQAQARAAPPEPPWGERNRWVVQAAIALAALAVGAIGVLAVRRGT